MCLTHDYLCFVSLGLLFITFCVSRRRRKMYCGHTRLCVCLSVCVHVFVYLSAAVRPHYSTDLDVTWGGVVEAAP